MARFTPIEQGEPRGDRYDEPRPGDDLFLHGDGERWVRGDSYEKAAGETACGAKLVAYDETYKRCADWRTRDNGRCRLHGGDSLSGSASGRFKHGLYSDALDGKMLSEFERYRDHEATLQLRDEITLLTAHIVEHVEQMSGGGGFNVLRKMSEKWDEVQEAREHGTPAEVSDLISELGALAERGGERAEELERLQDMMDTKRRLVKDEFKRVKDTQEMLRQSEIDALRMRMINYARTVFEKYDVPRVAQQEFSELLVRHLDETDQQRLDAG
jgi:hypothetical protein